jgi:WhiB family redox-sensing transcriptional regulator
VSDLRPACADHPDPELWFPVSDSDVHDERVQEAKQICDRCPIRSDCLDVALRTPGSSGIWGGLTEAERRALRQRERMAS